MVTLKPDAFWDAVAVAWGRPVPDPAWVYCADWQLIDRFRSRKKAEQAAAVREVVRCVQDYVDAARRTVAELDEVPDEAAPLSSSRAVRNPPAVAQEQPELFTPALSPYEQDRTWLFSLEVASLADALHGVRIRRFRKRALSDHLVPSDRVEAWLRDRANQPRVRELARQADIIARGLPAWSSDDAAFYILTNEPPPIHPVRGVFTRTRLARRQQRGVISLEVEPWVSEKTVARLYREVRARVLPRHDDRPRALAVLHFVEAQHAASRPTLRDVWRDIVAERPIGDIRLHEVWRQWRALHPEITSLTVKACFERWNEAHSDEAHLRFRDYTKFRAALLSGIEHGNTVVWPGYERLDSRQAGSESTTPISTPFPVDSDESL